MTRERMARSNYVEYGNREPWHDTEKSYCSLAGSAAWSGTANSPYLTKSAVQFECSQPRYLYCHCFNFVSFAGQSPRLSALLYFYKTRASKARVMCSLMLNRPLWASFACISAILRERP